MSRNSIARTFSQLMSYLLSKSLHARFRDVICWIARRACDALFRTSNNDQSWFVATYNGFGKGVASVDDAPKIDV